MLHDGNKLEKFVKVGKEQCLELQSFSEANKVGLGYYRRTA